MQVVISLYKEDPSWIRKIPDHWDVVVYTKYNHFPKCIKNTTIIPLDNVGRESHTYFYHICQNYHNLHDVTVFLQGRPFDHAPNVMNLLSAKEIPTKPGYFGIGHSQFKLNLVEMNLRNILSHVNPNHFTMLKEKVEVMQAIWEIFYDSPFPKDVFMIIGSQFAVSKKMIRNFPLSAYQEVFNIHLRETWTPWAVEKILPQIFLSTRYSLNFATNQRIKMG